VELADGPGNWWKSFYNEALPEDYLARVDTDELSATVSFLEEKLAVQPGSTIFDQCCGIGSLSIPLGQRGARVIGVDQCEAYIRRARVEAEASHLACDFHVGDAFEFLPSRPCDAAFNWWTSFGYAVSDLQNSLMLRRAWEALRAGGWFALDFPNMAHLLRHFAPSIVRRCGPDGAETMIVRESHIALDRGALEQRWTIDLPDGRRQIGHSSVRLYLAHHLANMLSDCGFEDIQFFGSVRGERLDLDSPRCICRARKP
jgi:SAM-dependent methyltransferase